MANSAINQEKTLVSYKVKNNSCEIIINNKWTTNSGCSQGHAHYNILNYQYKYHYKISLFQIVNAITITKFKFLITITTI